MTRDVYGNAVEGVEIDAESRCLHWHSELDVIAIKFFCCGKYFSCFQCHSELTEHEPGAWPVDRRDEKAVLCGSCGYELAIAEYFGCGFTCPSCRAGFNPGYAKHYDLYFA